MRSQAILLRQARAALPRLVTKPRSALLPTVRSSGRLRKQRSERVLARPASSDATASPSNNNSPSPPSFPPLPPSAGSSGIPPDEPTEEVEKARRRTRTGVAKDGESSPPPPTLPDGLEILWQPSLDGSQPKESHLPPPEVFQDVLTNLHITLHPQTQHRSVYTTAAGPPLEPTLALYCPIEGGDYIVDETVRELARRTGSDVVVIDAVQLAAGEWGHFGKASSVVEFPQNPLHFPSSPTSPKMSSRTIAPEEEEDDEPSHPFGRSSGSMTLQILAPVSPSRSRAFISASSRSSSANRTKAFFDALINLTPPEGEAPVEPGRPRLIYIRDFPTLAESSATWYPSLLAAVRQRRQGPLNKPSSAVPNPMTIVFGMTPPLTGASAPANSPMGQAIMSMLMNRQPPATSSNGVVSMLRSGARSLYGEDEASEKAREQRLRTRLRQWERGDVSALQDDIPKLASPADGSDGEGRLSKGPGEIVMMDGHPASGLPGALRHFLSGARPDSGRSGDGESSSSYFRTSVIVPSTRIVGEEKEGRMARRQEINELTMRMGVGAVGGALGKHERTQVTEADSNHQESTPADVEGGESDTPAEPPVSDKVWLDWGKRIEVWPTVRQIADRAVGIAVAEGATAEAAVVRTGKASLSPTQVSWDAVYRAWEAQRSARDVRKAWLQAVSSGRAVKEHEDDAEEGEDRESEESDEVVERVKRDPDLDQHEQRLLGCIVNSASMPTSFNQVHLPEHTVDSVRTIVSLPLLFPEAFQHGVLKEHGMTGCLLFGPPGTGKTLLARALAKEAGCRMMAISPSDVMDMYVGEGEKLVKSVFSLARRLAPCVVFLDEIDALFGARQSGRETGGTIAHRGVLTEFMQEMDGLRSSKDDNVIVIGATNRPFDLDDAVLRRLPRRLLVDLPGDKEREAILKILLREETLDSDVDLTTLARRTESFSGSDLKHLCVSAALDAVKENVDVPWDHRSSASPISSAPVIKDTPKVPEAQTLEPATADDSVVIKSTTKVDDSKPPSSNGDATSTSSNDQPAPKPRILKTHNFAKALKEITPSSSESLGTLADLRKWNDEFGEGRKEKKKVQVWGKGRFGFTIRPEEEGVEGGVRTT